MDLEQCVLSVTFGQTFQPKMGPSWLFLLALIRNKYSKKHVCHATIISFQTLIFQAVTLFIIGYEQK